MRNTSSRRRWLANEQNRKSPNPLSDIGLGGCLIVEMHEKSDAQLLREYAEGGSEAGFREIVVRHTDVLYSAALRQVSSPDLARDVVQSVFTDLARNAQSLTRTPTGNSSLLGWLYRSTRFAALNQLRDDRRRQVRERQAMEYLEPASETATDWECVHPLLEEAMSDLSDEDREALLLRFFTNRDFHAVGESLGVSDDTAQKRVSRALEKLRAEFGRRGVTTTAIALSTTLSANAVSVAPAGLAATFSTVALAGSTITTATIAAKAIAMTTLQKAIIAMTLAVVAGTGIYEARQASRLREQVQALQQEQAPLAEQIQQLQRERDEATNRVASLSDEIAALQNNSAELLKLRGQVAGLKSVKAALASAERDPAQVGAKAWAERVTQLKQRLEQTPGVAIPEFKFLTDANWLDAARDSLVTDNDYRRAFATLRRAVENQFIISMQTALGSYLKQSGGQFPSDLSQLKPYFETAPDDAMLQRYAIVPASSIPNVKVGGDSVITVKNPVDEEYDSLWALGPQGFGNTTYQGSKETSVLAPALKAYAAANNEQEPKNPSDLVPYLTTPEQQAAYQKLQQMRDTDAK